MQDSGSHSRELDALFLFLVGDPQILNGILGFIEASLLLLDSALGLLNSLCLALSKPVCPIVIFGVLHLVVVDVCAQLDVLLFQVCQSLREFPVWQTSDLVRVHLKHVVNVRCVTRHDAILLHLLRYILAHSSQSGVPDPLEPPLGDWPHRPHERPGLFRSIDQEILTVGIEFLSGEGHLVLYL